MNATVAQSRLTFSVGTNLRGYQDCVWEYDAVGNRVGETCYGKQVSYEIEAYPFDEPIDASRRNRC
ncbi:MAG: hypothetical protein AAF654_03230 [Myxococcota bacterium]